MAEKSKILTMRVFIVFFIIVSAGIALLQYKSSVTFIAQLMGISWGAMAGSFIAPFLFGLYWRRATKTAVWACFVAGLGITISNMFLAYLPPINAGALAILSGFVVLPVVSLLTKAPAKDRLDELFAVKR